MKSKNQIHKEWVEKSQKAQQQSYKNKIINSLSEADLESLKLLESLDKASGGNLPKLYQAYAFLQHESTQSTTDK